MTELTGKIVCKGIAIGKIKIYSRKENEIILKEVSDPEGEMARCEAAIDAAVKQLNVLYEKALGKAGKDGAELFRLHAMMLKDTQYHASIENIIRSRRINAEYAVKCTGEKLAQTFRNMKDDYFKARSADVKDISERVIRLLTGAKDLGDSESEPVILLCEDLTPSEIIQIDSSGLLAFATSFGSSGSHTAILARAMRIPALTGIGISHSFDGLTGIVDGYQGKLIIDPVPEVLEEYYKKKEEDDQRKALFSELKGKESVTKSGQKIRLYANIGSPRDLSFALEQDAEGIGLFRSEFLYLNSDHYPDEEEQFAVYRQVLESMGKKKVIIRTLDIGTDKKADYFALDREENPALGYRGIRICLTRPELFKTQLRALYRAGAYGNLSIMYPMITSLWEIREIKAISKAVRQELTSQGIRTGRVEEGIMIETPAAALICDELAKEADFISIGTNDLTQYTLAADRQNDKLERFYDPHHPAVLREIKMIAESAHKAGIRAGICGELASDPSMTGYFLEIGIDELSMNAGSILTIRKIIRESK